MNGEKEALLEIADDLEAAANEQMTVLVEPYRVIFQKLDELRHLLEIPGGRFEWAQPLQDDWKTMQRTQGAMRGAARLLRAYCNEP